MVVRVQRWGGRGRGCKGAITLHPAQPEFETRLAQQTGRVCSVAGVCFVMWAVLDYCWVLLWLGLLKLGRSLGSKIFLHTHWAPLGASLGIQWVMRSLKYVE